MLHLTSAAGIGFCVAENTADHPTRTKSWGECVLATTISTASSVFRSLEFKGMLACKRLTYGHRNLIALCRFKDRMAELRFVCSPTSTWLMPWTRSFYSVEGPGLRCYPALPCFLKPQQRLVAWIMCLLFSLACQSTSEHWATFRVAVMFSVQGTR